MFQSQPVLAPNWERTMWFGAANMPPVVANAV
jgi:hypothetical protein